MSGKRIDGLIWSDGLRRRSHRISALDQQHDKTTDDSVVTRTEKRTFFPRFSGIKRDREEEGVESQDWEQQLSPNDDKVVTEAKEKETIENGGTLLPDKHLLELVLDVLQRRDTLEIFGLPVDPQEVENYYDIIKEPMDFGTMRQKLHDKMYNNLEEFEHDAFLIPRNALQFNSTGSVYFRQARAIDDLAKKVFHVLKTNPKKLESEFSGTRRRASRRVQEGKALKIHPGSDFASNTSASGTSDVSSPNAAQYFDNVPSDIRKSLKSNPRSSKASRVGTRTLEFSSGAKDARILNKIEVDRRSTYEPPLPFDWGNDTMVSTRPGGPKMLTHVDQGHTSYSESLLKFAKGLGPVAQMVAKRKLQGCTDLKQNPGTLRAVIDLNNIDDGINSHTSCGNDTKNSFPKIRGEDEIFNRYISKPCGDLTALAGGVESLHLSGIRLDDASSHSYLKVENPNASSHSYLEVENPNASSHSYLKVENPNADSHSYLKVENPTTGVGFRNGFKRGFSNLRPIDGLANSTDMQPSPVVPSGSPFTFNLSFLQSQLNQMQHHSGSQVLGDGSATCDNMSSGYTQLTDLGRHSSILAGDNRQRFVPNSLGGNLTLKL